MNTLRRLLKHLGKTCKHTILDLSCPSCQALQAQWYKKLDPDQEIEDVKIKGNKVVTEDRLKVWHNHYFYQRHDPEKIKQTMEEFIEYERLLYTHKFKNATHKKIWELFSVHGKSKREISTYLKNNSRYKPYKPTRVLEIINQIKRGEA